MTRGLMAFLCLLAMAGAAACPGACGQRDPTPVWEIDGGNIDLIMTIPDLEAHRLTPDGPPPSDARLKAYLGSSASIPWPRASAARWCRRSRPCRQSRGFESSTSPSKCPSQTNLQIHSAAFYDLVPSHTNYAEIENVTTGEFTQQLLTRDAQTVDVTGGEGGQLKTGEFSGISSAWASCTSSPASITCHSWSGWC